MSLKKTKNIVSKNCPLAFYSHLLPEFLQFTESKDSHPHLSVLINADCFCEITSKVSLFFY